MCVTAAGRRSSEPSKLDVDVMCCTQTPFRAYRSRAHARVHMNTCLWTSGSRCIVREVFSESGSDLLHSCCQDETSETQGLVSAREASVYDEPLRLVSRCQVGGSLLLSLRCAHTVLSAGWHALWQGDMGQPKPDHRARHQLGPS